MNQVRKSRVLMADDHSILLAGLRKLIEDQCEVVETVENGRALLEAAGRLKPDLILLDISMPLLNGLEAARHLMKSLPKTKLLFLTMHASPRYAMEAFKVGAHGFLLKQSAVSELPQAIKAVLSGRHYLTPLIAKPVIDHALNAKTTEEMKGTVAELTPRQREILQLIGEGKGTKDIATLLDISVKTVQFHKACLMEELNMHTTAELMRYAITQGFTCDLP